MDEEVVIDLFNRAKSKGYTKSIEDFKLLLETDEEVVLDNFNYVKSKGYTKSIDDFKTLVKKKDETTELVSPQEEVVTTSVTEEVETPGVSDVSVSESIVEKPESKSFDKAISNISLDDIDRDEETIVIGNESFESFNDRFKDYGFSFQESSMGDAVTVFDYDGNYTEIDLQPFTSSGKQQEYNKLIKFLSDNRKDPETIKKDLDSRKEGFKKIAETENESTEISLLFPQVKTSDTQEITTGLVGVIGSLLSGQDQEDASVVSDRINLYFEAGGEKYKQKDLDLLLKEKLKFSDSKKQAEYDAKIQQRLNAQKDFIQTLSPERRELAEALNAVREAQRAGVSDQELTKLKQNFTDLYNKQLGDTKKLYNFDGTYIEEGNAPEEVVNFNNQVEEGSIEKYNSYTPEELENLQVDLLYKTIFAAKKINTHADRIYKDLGPLEKISQQAKFNRESLIDGESYDITSNPFIATSEIRKVANTGRITDKLPLLPGNSPLVQEYNKNVKQLLEIQGALALNYNPSTLEEGDMLTPLKAFAVSAYEAITGQNVRVADDMVKAYVSAREDAGLKVTQKDKQRAEDSVLDEGLAATGTIVPLIAEIALTKKAINLTGALKNMKVMTRYAQMQTRNPYKRFAIGFVSNGLQEALVFKSTGVLADQLREGGGEGMTGAMGFGFGAGGYAGGIITKALLGTRSPILQAALSPIQKSDVLRSVFNGTANATVGTGALYGAEFFDLMVNSDKDFSEAAAEVLDVEGSPLKKLLVSFSTMSALGLGNRKGWKNIYNAMRNDIKNYKPMSSSEYSNAVETLGLDPNKKYTAEEIKKAYRAKAKETRARTLTDVKEGVKDQEFIKVKEAYDKLTAEDGMLLEQQNIKEQEGYKKKKREMFFMANRMKNQVEFTGKEYELDYRDAESIKDLSNTELEVLTEDLKKQGITAQDAFTLQGKIETARNNLNTINEVGITDPSARKKVYDLLNKFTEADRKLEELNAKAKTSKANEALFSEKIKQQQAEVKQITDDLQIEITKADKEVSVEEPTEGVLRLEGKEPVKVEPTEVKVEPTEVKEEVVTEEAVEETPTAEVSEEVDKQIEEIDKKLNEKVTKTVEVSGKSRVSESDYDFYSPAFLEKEGNNTVLPIVEDKPRESSMYMFKRTGENTADFEIMPSRIEAAFVDTYNNLEDYTQTVEDSEISLYDEKTLATKSDFDIEIVKPGKARKNADGQYEIIEKAQIRITNQKAGTSFKNRTTKSKQTKTVEELKYQGEERKKLEEQKKAILSKKQTETPTAEVKEEVEVEEASKEEYLKEQEFFQETSPFSWAVDKVVGEDLESAKVFEYEGTFGVVTEDGDIKGVFNPNVAKQRQGKEKKKGTIRGLMPKLIDAGGVKLDNYDGRLTKIYENQGFRVAGRTPFNEEFAPEGWNKDRDGTPDVVAMVYDPDAKLNIEEKSFDSYDDMMTYRDSFLETPTTEVTEEVVEEKPSKERVDNIVEEIITKVRNRRGGKDTNPQVILEATKGYLQGSKLYEEATDIERESAVREINEKLGIKIPKAPSVKKILRKPKKKKVVVDEMAALKDQIKLEARAARGAVKDVNTRRKELAKQVKELQKKGKITSNQARVITNKISSVNLYNPKSVDGFVKYMEKVYDNAEYANKVLSANALRKRIKKGSKNKKKDAKLTDLAKSFSDIDPKFIDNIDEYLKVANSVLQGVVSSRVVGTDVNWRTSPDIVKVDNYINSELEKQREIILENKKQEFETITGIAASELSYDDMMAILESPKEIDENKEKLVRDNIGKVFNAYKSIINNIISTGRDPFTGEKIDTPNKKIIKEFMDMDLNDLTVKESIQAVDALNNYVTNGITSGMETVVSIYRGARNTKKLTDKGIQAKPLRLFESKAIGRIMGQQLTSLPILFERLFKGIDRSRKVMNAIGFNDITSGVSKARKIANVDIDTYVNKFSKTKPNGKAFNDAYNITERGLVAFMRRTLIGDGLKSKIEFDRRKSLIEQSIDKLEVGSTREQEKAKEYKEVYDAVLKDAKSIQDVEKNANKTNLDAVKWWNEKWANYYDELAYVSLNVYNKLLGSDVNYIPDSMRRLEDKKLEDFEWNESAFASAQDALYQKKTGILEEATRPKKLPKDRYISLDFDTNNASLLEAALIDIKTAAPIQQLKGSIESKYFNKLVPTKEDRSLLIDRLKGYVRRVRGKDFVGGSTAQDVNRLVNFLAGIGVSRVLGGLTQPVKQTLPVAANTLINAGRLDLSIITNSEVNKWLDESGYAIANRGLASEATLESINTALEKADKSLSDTNVLAYTGRKLFRGIEKLNKFWLQAFLVKPDAFIARASWISYYKQSLKKQGLKSNDIDWSTHKINKKAADYAQQQVDRQQNVSDADLQGDVMTSKKPWVQISRKVLIPFMNFILNQKARMYSDIITISSKTSSSKDKKSALRSIGGLLAETAVFNALSYIIGNILYNGAIAFTGQDESEEDKKKRIKKKTKGVITNIAKDVLVPVPIVDEPIIGVLNYFLNKSQADLPDSVEKFNLYNYQSDKYLDGFGVLSIGGQKLLQTAEIAEMASFGTYTTEFMNVETKKKLPPESIKLMQSLLPIAIAYNSGLLPSEVGSEINYIVKIIKKTGKKIKEDDLNELQGLLEGMPLE
tara:strand:- start:11221 stop:19131 length:7911 start_codon:yes stop_codon:yes gene_type:complete